jgi:hypothetical protein
VNILILRGQNALGKQKIQFLLQSSSNVNIQGADDKLGQFLGLDIEASANHRNVLRHSLESYSSLVSRNVSKPSLVKKMCRQSTKLLQLSKKLCAPSRNQQGIEKFLKVHRSLVYLLKTVLNQNQDIGEADVLLSNINTKKSFWPHEDSGFCGLAAQNTAKITQDWLKAEGPLVPGNLASQLKRL